MKGKEREWEEVGKGKKSKKDECNRTENSENKEKGNEQGWAKLKVISKS